MDENMKKTVDFLRTNPAAAQALFRSQDGQRLIQLLTAADGGASLNKAAQSAAGGDMSQMAQMIRTLMSSPEGAALAERISKAVQK